MIQLPATLIEVAVELNFFIDIYPFLKEKFPISTK